MKDTIATKNITVTLPMAQYNEIIYYKQFFNKKYDIIYLQNHWNDDFTKMFYDEKALDEIQKRVIYILKEYEAKLSKNGKHPLSKKANTAMVI